MKKLRTVLVCVGLLVGLWFLIWWIQRDQELRRNWPARQLKNAVTIGSKLWPYHEAHGKYPERLGDLVADGIFTAEELEALRFQSEPGAPREDWIYQVPPRLDAIAIESPRTFAEDGYRIIARADGSGEVVKNELVYSIIRKREIAFTAAYGSEAVAPANGISPDGRIAARVEAGADRDFLCVYLTGNGSVLARLPMGGFARYPMDADSSNLQLLWSPDSKHFALMIRGTKTTWSATSYALEDDGLREIPLRGATAKALELVSASETYRSLHETPVKWIDNDQLLLRASGDTMIEGRVNWYEVDLTYSLKSGEIVRSKVVLLKFHDG